MFTHQKFLKNSNLTLRTMVLFLKLLVPGPFCPGLWSKIARTMCWTNEKCKPRSLPWQSWSFSQSSTNIPSILSGIIPWYFMDFPREILYRSTDTHVFLPFCFFFEVGIDFNYRGKFYMNICGINSISMICGINGCLRRP